MKDKLASCVDCGTVGCRYKEAPLPQFCLTEELTDQQRASVMAAYREAENKKTITASADVEYESYCKDTRVEEIIKFAKATDAKKLGIATCVGLIRESGILAKILRKHGFEVFGVGCKIGAIPKVEVGIDKKCEAVGETMCNPIMQAKLLNKEKTDLNIVMGLCVGHDSLFYKYSDALATTLVTKDRVLGHNPAAALYTSGSYYKKLLDCE